ncbi:MAG TPA: hypothetical protein VE890_17515 [Thermoguttaceae bacterium]|nr:hypothetical protein [Thermoguttaceae bacterium]
MKKRDTEEQIAFALRQHESGTPVAERGSSVSSVRSLLESERTVGAYAPLTIQTDATSLSVSESAFRDAAKSRPV